MKYDRVFKEIKRDELIQLTQDLVRIPSVRRPGEGEKNVALFLSHLLDEMGLDVVVEEVEPGSPNVIAVLQGREEGSCEPEDVGPEVGEHADEGAGVD